MAKRNKTTKKTNKNLTALQQEYSNEIKRLNRAQHNLEKQGYIFNESTAPKLPKRVTRKALTEIKNIKPKDLKKKSVAKADTSTGEITKDTRLDNEYPLFSDMVIFNFLFEISHYPAVAEPMLRKWINELIRQYGKDDVAEMLEEGRANGIWISYQVAYDTQLLLSMISSMMEYLPDASDWFKKELAEKFEYGEDWESPE